MTGFLIVTHRVADYRRWKAVFDQSEELRRKYGLSGGWITRDPDDKNELTVIVFSEDLSRAKEFMDLPQLREWMNLGGVEGEPEIRMVEEVTAVADVTAHR